MRTRVAFARRCAPVLDAVMLILIQLLKKLIHLFGEVFALPRASCASRFERVERRPRFDLWASILNVMHVDSIK